MVDSLPARLAAVHGYRALAAALWLGVALTSGCKRLRSLDISGTALVESLRAAANRGVRVRLLLDDNNTSGLDLTLAELDAHPNIEVRLFNPFVSRIARGIDYMTDFFRLNRRMHNKSFTADNQVTIIGGRNVGDEYFGRHRRRALCRSRRRRDRSGYLGCCQ
jgi:phosphatidylserine/phosphatidylglycerophosphate/cardiolipin synthase-like enzyme